ncbi:hypothetical protein CFAM422_005300 [Trichoderma lentiforme]|uniref:Nucleoside phosphorylase domain-containing protein n=1 Tax=Trichoderma lentiforme TaxID=1567552 RepID=A0A9P4XH97_9HYPO|nr:hypothetical protein CFAM422_005300 [Trichoderma lentiforme]
MPYLIELNEWRLLRGIGSLLDHRKAPYVHMQSRPFNDLRDPNADLFEVELRRAFMVQELPRDLNSREFEECQAKLESLCLLLDRLVLDNLVSNSLAWGQSHSHEKIFPRLRALTTFLESTSETVDLAIGANRTLFKLPNGAELGRCLQIVTECNDTLSRLTASAPQEPTVQPLQKQQKKRMWKKARIRNRSTFVLGTLFEHFRCGTSHEVLLKLTEDPDEESVLPSLQLMLSPCPELELWQEVQCESVNLGETSISRIPDICTDIRQHTGQGKALMLLIEKYGIFGAWANPTSSGPDPSSKESLNQLIEKGAFKPLDLHALIHGASQQKFSTKDKRALAVKLGFCLMDFFDADITSKRIYFLNASKPGPKEGLPYLAFGSKLPATADPYSFRMGHPALLSFAKLLLEIDFGQCIDLEISPYNSQNQVTWAKLVSYVDRLEEDRSDSYLEAIRACLHVHRKIAEKLRSRDLDSKGADSRIRKTLYKEVVHKLELGLAESIPRPAHKRQRSESPPASDDRNRAQIGHSWKTAPRSLESQPFTAGIKRRRTPEQHSWSSRAVSESAPSEHSSLSDLSIAHSETSFCSFRPNSREGFQIALICALRVEFDAVEALFDDYYEQDFSYSKAPGDPNAYTTGRMCGHDVVLAFMPGMGKVNSASVAAGFRASFPGIRLGLVVGICGGVPVGTDDEKEVLLGDVIISTALVQFDFGRQYANKAVRRDTLQDNLGRPNAEIRAFLTKLSGSRGRKTLRDKTSVHLEELCGKDGFKQSSYPAEDDKLYLSTYRHKHQDGSCAICTNCTGPEDDVCEAALESTCEELHCQDSELVWRARVDKSRGVGHYRDTSTTGMLEARKPVIHFGIIVSGDSVMKSGQHRDEIASREKAIAFEMEGAGVWESFPTVVIKSVCDYADSHKNKKWQRYAAATAAACMKAFLGEWRPAR